MPQQLMNLFHQLYRTDTCSAMILGISKISTVQQIQLCNMCMSINNVYIYWLNDAYLAENDYLLAKLSQQMSKDYNKD